MSTFQPWRSHLKGANPDGTFTADFVRWLQRAIVERIGGPDAPTNLELLARIEALEGRVTTLEGP